MEEKPGGKNEQAGPNIDWRRAHETVARILREELGVPPDCPDLIPVIRALKEEKERLLKAEDVWRERDRQNALEIYNLRRQLEEVEGKLCGAMERVQEIRECVKDCYSERSGMLKERRELGPLIQVIHKAVLGEVFSPCSDKKALEKAVEIIQVLRAIPENGTFHNRLAVDGLFGVAERMAICRLLKEQIEGKPYVDRTGG